MGDPFVTNQPIKLENVVFTEASPAQRQAAFEHAGQSWAAPLSIADFAALMSRPYGGPDSDEEPLQKWVLALKSDPSEIIASCSTIRKEVLIADLSGFRMAIGYGIAAVYTNPKYRRLGMAAYLMRCVQEVVDRSGKCSALYSDIGRRYYKELGWPIFPSAQVTVQLLAVEGGTIRQAHAGQTAYLAMEGLPPLCARDVESLKQRFQSLGADGKTHVAFSPSWPQIASQLAWEDVLARTLRGKEIVHRGAITLEKKSWLYWEHNLRGEKLVILRVVTSTLEPVEQRVADIAALLEAAVVEAAHWGFKQVVLWNPDELLTLGTKAVGNDHEGVVTVIFDERLDEAIPEFRWKGGSDTKNTVWEENFYYAHC